MLAYWNKLKHKWNIGSNWHLFLIMLAFSLAGLSVVQVNNLVIKWLGFNEETPLYIRIITRILVIFPSYQVLLLFWGFVLGQFDFFLEKEKRLFRWFGKILGISR